MREIPLTQGKVTIVSQTDYDNLRRFKWFAMKSRSTWYAMRRVKNKHGSYSSHSMHREILGLKPGDKRQADHRDGHGLNNQRDNLRVATVGQNKCNQPKHRLNKSGYKGVIWEASCSKWKAQIRVDGTAHHLGCFSDLMEAAKAYDKAARELHGEFARTNF